MIQNIKNAPLSEYCTFRTGGRAKMIYTPSTADEITEIITRLRSDATPYFILGKGSNILVSDKGYNGAIIHLGENYSNIFLNDNNEIICESGASLFSLSNYALTNSLTGLEFASGIPGSVGGGVAMNAGAYGNELKDVIKTVTILSAELKTKTLTLNELNMGYRHSIIQEENAVVLSACFALKTGNQDDIRAKIKELNHKRTTKQPLNFASAGSTFKRPAGYYAGTLIEECGLKGVSVGGAQVSEKHAGFIVNKGTATSSDIYALIKFVQKTVYEKKGVYLQPEVHFLGEFK